jgi:glycosyltransferase involved in cell wall biosynthesis
MKLLYFNLLMDADHPVLGFASRWVDAIAERVEGVTVITMEAGRVEPRSNVEVLSVGKERDWSEPRRFLEFYRQCGRTVRSIRPDVCFSHMMPRFSILFAPIGRVRRIPALLWYAHGAVPLELRIAERLVDRCVTSTPEGFRLSSGKLFVLQQGIDGDRFGPPESPGAKWERTVVSVGRISPVKQLKESVEAIAAARNADNDIRLEVFGAPATEDDRVYEQEVRQLAESLGLSDVVTFNGPLAHERVVEAYQRGGLFLNLGRSGSLDKAILEAIACGCIPICDNDAFVPIARSHGWERLVPEATGDVAAALMRTLAMPTERKSKLRSEMREFVVKEHSLNRLADRIVGHLDEMLSHPEGRTRRG